MVDGFSCLYVVQEAGRMLPMLLKGHLWKSQITRSLFSPHCLTNRLRMLRGNCTFQISVCVMWFLFSFTVTTGSFRKLVARSLIWYSNTRQR